MSTVTVELKINGRSVPVYMPDISVVQLLINGEFVYDSTNTNTISTFTFTKCEPKVCPIILRINGHNIPGYDIQPDSLKEIVLTLNDKIVYNWNKSEHDTKNITTKSGIPSDAIKVDLYFLHRNTTNRKYLEGKYFWLKSPDGKSTYLGEYKHTDEYYGKTLIHILVFEYGEFNTSKTDGNELYYTRFAVLRGPIHLILDGDGRWIRTLHADRGDFKLIINGTVAFDAKNQRSIQDVEIKGKSEVLLYIDNTKYTYEASKRVELYFGTEEDWFTLYDSKKKNDFKTFADRLKLKGGKTAGKRKRIRRRAKSRKIKSAK